MRHVSTEAVADQIVDLSRSGMIPTPFRVKNCAVHFPDTSETHLNTVLANYEENGDMVVRAKQRPRFKRVSRGLYKPL